MIRFTKPILWVAMLLFLAGSVATVSAQPMSQYGVGLVSQPAWLQAQYYLRITNAFGAGTNIFLTYTSNKVFINVSGIFASIASSNFLATNQVLSGTNIIVLQNGGGEITVSLPYNLTNLGNLTVTGMVFGTNMVMPVIFTNGSNIVLTKVTNDGVLTLTIASPNPAEDKIDEANGKGTNAYLHYPVLYNQMIGPEGYFDIGSSNFIGFYAASRIDTNGLFYPAFGLGLFGPTKDPPDPALLFDNGACLYNSNGIVQIAFVGSASDPISNYSRLNPAWDDVRIGIGSLSIPPANAAEMSDFAGNIQAMAFSKILSNALGFELQLPHGMDTNYGLHLHIHWSCKTNAGPNTNVVWGLDYTVANLSNIFPTVSTILLITNSPATNYYHGTAEFPTVYGLKESAVMVGRIFRFHSNPSDNLDDEAFLLSLDAHYVRRGFGSINEDGDYY